MLEMSPGPVGSSFGGGASVTGGASVGADENQPETVELTDEKKEEELSLASVESITCPAFVVADENESVIPLPNSPSEERAEDSHSLPLSIPSPRPLLTDVAASPSDADAV